MTARATEKLKSLKDSSGLTIDQIAEKSGVSKSTINRAFSGETVSMYSLNKIVGVFGYDVDKFSEETNGIGYVPQSMFYDMINQKNEDLKKKDIWIKILFIVCILFAITTIIFATFAFNT